MKKPNQRHQQHLLKRRKKFTKRREKKQAKEREFNLLIQELASAGMLNELRAELEAEEDENEEEELPNEGDFFKE